MVILMGTPRNPPHHRLARIRVVDPDPVNGASAWCRLAIRRRRQARRIAAPPPAAAIAVTVAPPAPTGPG